MKTQIFRGNINRLGYVFLYFNELTTFCMKGIILETKFGDDPLLKIFWVKFFIRRQEILSQQNQKGHCPKVVFFSQFDIYIYIFVDILSVFFFVSTVIKKLQVRKGLPPNFHCVKSIRIRSFSGMYFPAFGLNTDQKNSNIKRI